MNGYREKKGVIETIIIINVIIYALPEVFSIVFRNITLKLLVLNIGALQINLNDYMFAIENGAIWQILTSMFLHGGIAHLFFNMYALYMFGKPLEIKWGGKKFLTFYLSVGILANIGSVIFLKLTGMPTLLIGASGAVYGVLLAFAGYYPEVKLLLFFFIPMKVKWAIVTFTALSMYFQISGSMTRIAHFTHLFGFLFAFLYLFLIFKTNPIKEMFFPDKTERFYYDQHR